MLNQREANGVVGWSRVVSAARFGSNSPRVNIIMLWSMLWSFLCHLATNST